MREHLLARGQRYREEDDRGESRGDGHEVKDGLAAVAQVLHDEDVPGVEHRRDDAEGVAEEGGGGEGEAGPDEHGDAGEGGGEPGEEQSGRLLAEEEPGGEGDEDRGEVGEQGGVRYRGELDRGVPERQVAGECKAGGEKKEVVPGKKLSLGS